MPEGQLIYEIKSQGCNFWSGIAPRYDDEYPEEILSGIISKNIFNNMISEINDNLTTYWPCPLWYIFIGYILGCLTLGLCWIFPYKSIKEAKSSILRIINVHDAAFRSRYGISVKLEEKCPWRSSIKMYKCIEEA